MTGSLEKEALYRYFVKAAGVHSLGRVFKKVAHKVAHKNDPNKEKETNRTNRIISLNSCG